MILNLVWSKAQFQNGLGSLNTSGWGYHQDRAFLYCYLTVKEFFNCCLILSENYSIGFESSYSEMFKNLPKWKHMVIVSEIHLRHVFWKRLFCCLLRFHGILVTVNTKEKQHWGFSSFCPGGPETKYLNCILDFCPLDLHGSPCIVMVTCLYKFLHEISCLKTAFFCL